MSILTKPYELSVWEDVLENGEFVEKRLGIIGTQDMDYQGRAIEPILTRNVNGTKKLTFKMYRKYVDSMTGQKVINPYIDWLISERKVKLKYGTYVDDNGEMQDRWYDFIIKDITENSTDYLYTYSLEDALVQELSKNGFGVVLDEKRSNNMNTAKKLAKTVLEETDWSVESEVFVQKVQDHLIYVEIPAGTKAQRIKDQQKSDLSQGITRYTNEHEFKNKAVALAFYSCCKNKPYRFQFIYLPSYSKNNVKVSENQIILEEDCQYYIDIDNPNTGYAESNDLPGFYIPKNWKVKTQSGTTSDTTISNWFRGDRYGFAQQAVYVPLLDRYCNSYTGPDDEKYYGFVENEYISPSFVQNMVTNTEFKSTSGWLGTYTGETGKVKDSFGVKVEPTCGHFLANKTFSSVIDELTSGTYSVNVNYTAYLKTTIPKSNLTKDCGILINSGFYDNRTLIKNVAYDEEWLFEPIIYKASGERLSGAELDSAFDFYLREVSYNITNGSYDLGKIWATGTANNSDASKTYGKMVFNSAENISTTHADVNISEDDFKKKEIKLVIQPKYLINNAETTYYIANLWLHRMVENDKGELIKPGDLDTEGIVQTKYKFFKASLASSADAADKIVYDTREILEYSTYKPVLNEDGNKVRSVTAKESNYFNILQNIAETFEAWLDIKVRRDRYGAIQEKIVVFKNYVGKDNLANFRYGVNLKDIQRTYSSKNIVTKLLVKQNSNEHAKNGFCTIARANSNVTGENYLYDFRYYHKKGLLNETAYIDEICSPVSKSGVVPIGPDIISSATTSNLQNYFERVKSLNNKIVAEDEIISSLSLDLTNYKAELAVQEGLLEAAEDNMETTRKSFYQLVGIYPENISSGKYSEITCTIPSDKESDDHANELNYGEWAKDATITANQIGAIDSLNWNFNIAINQTKTEIPIQINAHTEGASWSPEAGKPNAGHLVTKGYLGLKIDASTKENDYQKGYRYKLSYKLQKDSGASTRKLMYIGGHSGAFTNYEIRYKKGEGDWITIKNESRFAVEDDRSVYEIEVYGTYIKDGNLKLDNTSNSTDCFFIQPNRGGEENMPEVSCNITDIKLERYSIKTSEKERAFYFKPTFTLKPKTGTEDFVKSEKLACTIPAYYLEGTKAHSLAIVDTSASSVARLLNEYATYKAQYLNAKKQIDGCPAEDIQSLKTAISNKESELKNKQDARQTLVNQKAALNKLFYSRYYRFIQEGTWISEEYVDDEKYYIDAQSVMYNSCFPQAAYTINVISLAGLPEYSGYVFELGDKTYVVDPDFFGTNLKEEVILSEMSENLDNPSLNVIKVQTFKNQFQDLFQKITATVQQAQYSTGAYEKAAELAEATPEQKDAFFSGALSNMGSKLVTAGQTTVIQDVNGITLTDSATKDQMRLIGGAILMSTENPETGKRAWKTGLTPDGISASLITAGVIDAGVIEIMNANDPVFRWDSYGLSAFDVDWSAGTAGKANPYKFVRFDKHGVYGINTQEGQEGSISGVSWAPTSNSEIEENATFSLTWEGLRVNNGEGQVHIGKTEDKLISVSKNGINTFTVSKDGDVNISGQLTFESFTPETQAMLQAESLEVEIRSSRGNIFTSRDVNTTLSCHVFKMGKEITDEIMSSQFQWKKFNDDGTQDTTWSPTKKGNSYQSILISPADLKKRATFTCTILV